MTRSQRGAVTFFVAQPVVWAAGATIAWLGGVEPFTPEAGFIAFLAVGMGILFGTVAAATVEGAE